MSKINWCVSKAFDNYCSCWEISKFLFQETTTQPLVEFVTLDEEFLPALEGYVSVNSVKSSYVLILLKLYSM